MTTLNIEIGDEEYKKIQKMASDLEIDNTRMYNLAMTLLEKSLIEMKKGNLLAVVDDREETITIIVLPEFERFPQVKEQLMKKTEG